MSRIFLNNPNLVDRSPACCPDIWQPRAGASFRGPSALYVRRPPLYPARRQQPWKSAVGPVSQRFANTAIKPIINGKC